MGCRKEAVRIHPEFRPSWRGRGTEARGLVAQGTPPPMPPPAWWLDADEDGTVLFTALYQDGYLGKASLQ